MKKYFIYTVISTGMLLAACHSKENTETASEEPAVPVTPVTVISVNNGSMQEFADLNATSVFQQKWILRSNVTGYLQKVNLQLNKSVSKGEIICTIKTKEAESIGNTINILDSSFKFTGITTVHSNGTGFISEIDHQAGDYVQEGEQLAVITDTKSFVFLMDLPYEMRPYIIGKTVVQLLLPDGEKLDAYLSGNMPVMDSATQTQRIVLKVNATHPIPENLIAKVRLVKKENKHASYLPKLAILANETQSDFWVMKMINDSTAAKVEIKKGIENGNDVEIISPAFLSTDKIITTGNFGLADTARVKIITAEPDKK